jgi:biopolymer transport protein ExbD
MKRFGTGNDDGGESGVDISPLIDCIFILLLFFIVTTSFVKEVGVEVDKPQAASAQKLERNSIMLAVTQEGQVIYGGEELGLSGVRTLVKRMLRKEDLPVIVKTDRLTPSWLLVKVIDEAKLGGAQRVSIATLKGDED